MARIYLDNNATTALDPRVFKAMIADFSGPPANPSSVHYFGQQARAQLTAARLKIASFFEAKPEEVIFTSGGTESINLILKGYFGTRPKGHIITTALEHSAVYQTVQQLEGAGLEVTYLKIDSWGAPLPQQIEQAIQANTRALVLSAANSETGVKLDLDAISKTAQRCEIPLILDAVAYIGKERLPCLSAISAFAVSGHKFHAPKGIGCAVIRPTFKIIPLFAGGGQEFQKRAGTENLAGILGLAEATQILSETQDEITHKLKALQNHFESSLLNELPGISINGLGPRICNTSNISFAQIDGESLLMHLDMAGIAASHGSACASGALEPSRVLLKMGLDKRAARSSVRFSLSRFTTREEIDSVIKRLIEVVSKLRK